MRLGGQTWFAVTSSISWHLVEEERGWRLLASGAGQPAARTKQARTGQAGARSAPAAPRTRQGPCLSAALPACFPPALRGGQGVTELASGRAGWKRGL